MAEDKGKPGKGDGRSFLDKWRDGDAGTTDLAKGPHGWTSASHPYKGPGDGNGPPKIIGGKSCIHDGTVASFTIERPGRAGTVTIYGARGQSLMKEGRDLSHLDLLIDMSGFVKRPTTKGFAKPGSWQVKALNAAAFPDLLSLDWPDMTAPNHVPARFWAKLLAALPKHVCISCIGSHGRTGTAMACLLVAGGMSADKAIAKVRQDHCSHAIETPGQQAYIRRVSKDLNGE